MESDLLVRNYDYDLPEELIAKYPITPRDMAKLLVYDRAKDKIIHTIFRNILDFVGDKHFIFNNTKVIKARIYGVKETGGKVELLLNRPVKDNFLVYIRGKVKKGTKLFFDKGLVAEVLELLEDGSRIVEFFQNNKKLDFLEVVKILEEIGHIPLTPYI